MAGCRDCKTCTKSLLGKLVIKTAYLVSFAWLVKPVIMRNCPQCHHLMGRHQRRADGSFRD
ncbi:hypothetical protein [Embleya sp. NPDC005971]|uniref:hypothetical protein n=1 Tax=Embleya sp. NPDC005971 TaxID=3156724 RepID=UPI0033D61BAA